MTVKHTKKDGIVSRKSGSYPDCLGFAVDNDILVSAFSKNSLLFPALNNTLLILRSRLYIY